MRVPNSVATGLEWAGSLSRSQAVVRGTVLGAAIGYLVCLAGAQGGNGVLDAMVVIAALASVARPDSGAGLILLGVCAVSWMATVDTVVDGWTLGAATCLLWAHAGLGLAATAAKSGPVSPRTAARWLAQSAAVMLACTGGWLLVIIVRGSDAPGLEVVAMLGLLAAVALIALVWRAGFSGLSDY